MTIAAIPATTALDEGQLVELERLSDEVRDARAALAAARQAQAEAVETYVEAMTSFELAMCRHKPDEVVAENQLDWIYGERPTGGYYAQIDD